jgi:hypothetical protein
MGKVAAPDRRSRSLVDVVLIIFFSRIRWTFPDMEFAWTKSDFVLFVCFYFRLLRPHQGQPEFNFVQAEEDKHNNSNSQYAVMSIID